MTIAQFVGIITSLMWDEVLLVKKSIEGAINISRWRLDSTC